MNILITLPKDLLENIIWGRKQFEMRKCLPEQMTIGDDGFFVVEKGTDKIRCWCRVDSYRYVSINYYSAIYYAHRLCVPEEYVHKYANGKKVFLWKIGKVIEFKNLKREWLQVNRNPQQYVYCPFSYGEPFEFTGSLRRF